MKAEDKINFGYIAVTGLEKEDFTEIEKELEESVGWGGVESINKELDFF